MMLRKLEFECDVIDVKPAAETLNQLSSPGRVLQHIFNFFSSFPLSSTAGTSHGDDEASFHILPFG